jgi:hypothetical protein
MYKLILALGVSGLLLGCGGGNGFDGILKKGKEFKDKTCACKDQACLDGVEKEMEAWFEKAVKDFKGKPSKAQEEQWDKIEQEAEACEDKIKEADRAKQGETVLAAMKQLKDEMCACADQACADKVQQKLMEQAKATADLKPTDEQLKQATALGEELAKCMAKAMTLTEPTAPADPSAAPADPAAPPAAPPAP